MRKWELAKNQCTMSIAIFICQDAMKLFYVFWFISAWMLFDMFIRLGGSIVKALLHIFGYCIREECKVFYYVMHWLAFRRHCCYCLFGHFCHWMPPFTFTLLTLFVEWTPFTLELTPCRIDSGGCVEPPFWNLRSVPLCCPVVCSCTRPFVQHGRRERAWEVTAQKEPSSVFVRYRLVPFRLRLLEVVFCTFHWTRPPPRLPSGRWALCMSVCLVCFRLRLRLVFRFFSCDSIFGCVFRFDALEVLISIFMIRYRWQSFRFISNRTSSVWIALYAYSLSIDRASPDLQVRVLFCASFDFNFDFDFDLYRLMSEGITSCLISPPASTSVATMWFVFVCLCFMHTHTSTSSIVLLPMCWMVLVFCDWGKEQRIEEEWRLLRTACMFCVRDVCSTCFVDYLKVLPFNPCWHTPWFQDSAFCSVFWPVVCSTHCTHRYFNFRSCSLFVFACCGFVVLVFVFWSFE